MQSEPSRYINSVSDLLYSTDEIEFLLDDIRDLEPTSCNPEDIQVEWTKSLTSKLIDLWEELLCLYDPKNKFYPNKHARADALNKIGEKLSEEFDVALSSEEVKKKLNNLRSQFYHELTKIKEVQHSGMAVYEVHEPSVWWFQRVYFLKQFIKTRKSKSNLELFQDFEIAGSRTGALSTDCAGGCECESPLGTVNSWDSHSHYRRRVTSPDLSLYSGVIVYCDHTHLKTPTGFVRFLLLVTTIACLTCLCTSGTVKVGLFMLPLVGRLRLMMFVTLLSIFVTCLLLFLDISHIVYLFPFNWGKLNAYFYISLSVLFLVASSLIFHSIFLSEAFYWVPKWTHHQLLITGCLGYLCSFQSAILSLIQKCTRGHYQPVAEDPSLNLQERQTSLPSTPEHKMNQTTHNYKPMTNYPVVASTSRQEANNYLDDVQPCSSKSSDPYRVA